VDLLHSFWRNLGLVCHKRRTGFLRKRGPNRRVFLFNDDTWEKNEGGYCIWACAGQKPPSVSPNSSPAGRNSSCKIGTVTDKPKMLKKEAERWLRFSLLVAPLQKLREVFVLQPVLRKNLSRIFKIHLRFPRNCLGRTHAETGKNGKNMKKWFFSRKAVFRTPPEVVSGFFFFFFFGGGGGGSAGIGTDTWRGGGFENHYSGPPPLVKVRMVRGGPEFLWSV
jgi:hypothetical protein